MNLLNIIVSLCLFLAASHAALLPQVYWKTMLPNTPMPRAISELLQPVDAGQGGVDVNAGKEKPGGTSVNVGKGGVHVDANKGKPGHTAVNVGKGGVNVNSGKGKPGGGTSVNVGHKGVGVNTGKPGGRTKVGVGKGGVTVNTGHKGRHVFVGVRPSPTPFYYKYAATETQLHDEPTVALFFLEKDMVPDAQKNLHFTKDSRKGTFLPRKVAESIPFSSKMLPQIFEELSVKPGSEEAEIMKNTIKECEESGIRGEEKYCATSLESMIDFSTSKLGRHVQAISTEVEKTTKMQKYRITAGIEEMADGKSIVCHKQNYAYAVFYCHMTNATKVYRVPLEGADGTKAKAVAVCHKDTTAWNPKHLAFQVLKIKPGTTPICHFLPEDHVVWMPK